MPLACCHASCWPLGPCDVRGVMRHLGPGASRKRVPPSPDVPSGNTLGSITRRSHKYPTACSPRASTKSGSLSLASSGHYMPHGQAGGGSRLPTVPLRFTAARHLSDAFSLAASSAFPITSGVRHTMPPAPQDSRSDASGIALRERRSCRPHRRLARPPPGANGVKCCPRHSRRFRVRASLVQLQST